ncbi:MAG TPA: outer membrane protein transport protein, partial [Alphaproteobacteria bacterium]|nr:outer membrane protein transport protein [Alphaproteobacteria bacterium]
TGACMSATQCTFGIGPQSIKSDNSVFFIPHFGMNWMLNPQSSVGISVYGNGGMNTKYKGGTATYGVPMGTVPPGTSMTTPGTFGAGTTGVDLQQLFIAGTYSRKLSSTSSVGVSLIAAYQKFKAEGLNSFAPYSSDPAHLSNNGYDDSTGFGAKIGWQGEVTPGLALGASYQTKMSMSKFSKYAGLFADKGSFDIPATATIGLAYDATPSSKVAFDVQKIFYSDIDSIANPMLPNLMTARLGDSNGPGFGWKDMTIYKLGYQWATSPDWTWRVGYSHGSQPIPSSEVVFNILAPAVMEDHITFGFTNKLSATSDWSFAFMYAPNADLTGKNPLDPAQTIKLEMTQYQAEASYSWKF